MAGPSSGLLLKFGYEPADLQKKLVQTAADVTRNMAVIAAAATATSQTLRTELASGVASASKSIVSYTLTWNNLRTAASLTSEAMKVGFALHHPVLAIGMNLLGSYKYALGAVAAGVLTASEAIKWMGDEVARVNDIIAKSEKAGVSGTFFQVWTEQAVKARLSVEEMERALQHASQALRPTFTTGGEQNINEFLRYADQLQNGRGFATQSYQAMKEAGYDMDKWHTAGALLVQDFQRAAVELGDVSLKAQAGQIATQLWGEAGTRIAAALAEGKISAQDAATAAKENARIYSADLLKATADVNQQLAEARDHLDKAMHPAMEALVQLSNEMLKLWAGIVEHTARFVDLVNTKAPGWIEAIGRNTAGAGDIGLAARGAIASTRASPFGDLSAGAPSGADLSDLERAMRARYREGGSFGNVPLPPTRPSLSVLESTSPHTKSAKDAATESVSAVEQYIASLEKANAVAQAELETIGKSNIEKAKAVDLARAEEAAKKDGVALTDEQRTKVLALAEAEGRLKDQTDETNKAIAARKAMGDYFSNMGESAIEKLIVDHGKLRDVLADVVKELERAAIKYALLGGGFGQSGGGGLFGSLFGGKGGGGGGLSGLAGLFSGGSIDMPDWFANLIGFNPFGFSDGGMVGRTSARAGFVSAGAFLNAPRFADGGGIPAIVHAGEIILNQAQQKNVAAAMGSGVTVHNYAAGVQVEPRVTREGVQLIVREALGAYHSSVAGAAARRW